MSLKYSKMLTSIIITIYLSYLLVSGLQPPLGLSKSFKRINVGFLGSQTTFGVVWEISEVKFLLLINPRIGLFLRLDIIQR
jgi:hypothetical protein